MSPKEPLDEVELVFNNVRPVDPGLYILYVTEGRLGIRRYTDPAAEEASVCTVNSKDINEGLTPNRWSRIDAQLRMLKKKGILK